MSTLSIESSVPSGPSISSVPSAPSGLFLLEAYKNKEGQIKSCVVYGDTKPYKDQLIAMGGKYNPKLNISEQPQPGYYFPLNKLESIKDYLNGKLVEKTYHKIDELPYSTTKPIILIPNANENKVVGEHLYLHPKGSSANMIVSQPELDGFEFVVDDVSYTIKRN